MIVFVPLIIFSVLALAALIVSIVAINRSRLHPDCACRRIMEENPMPPAKGPLMILGDPPEVELLSPKNVPEEPPTVYHFG